MIGVNYWTGAPCQIHRPPEARFWSKVRKTEGCWLWQGQTDRKGYGRFTPAGRHPSGCGNQLMAHRYSWEITHGPVPVGLWVLHRCDRPACVNPDHLFLGDALSNVQDMDRKGRRVAVGFPGVSNPRSIVSAADAAEIRRLYATGEWTYPELGAKFGLRRAAVGNVITGNHWTNPNRRKT